jgi:ribosomal protein L5
LAATTLSCPAKKVVSKKAVSGFKLAKNTVLAVKTTLRGDMMNQFCYKWYFISAQQDNAVNKTGWEYDQGNS